MYSRSMGLSGKNVVDLLAVLRAGAVVRMRFSALACAEKSVGESQLTIDGERQESFAIIVERITSVRSKYSTFIITAPYRPLPSSHVSIQQYKHSFVGICSTKSSNFCQKTHFSSASLVIESVGAYATTKLSASHLPANSKPKPYSRSSMNW